MDNDKCRTIDDVRRCAGKLPLPAVLHLVKSYNATRLSDIPEAAFLDFVDHCELMVSAEAILQPDPMEAELGLFCRLC